MATTTATQTNAKTPPDVEAPSKVDVKGARALFDEILASSGKIDTRVVIERDGVPIGVLVPVEDLGGLTRLDEQIARRLRILDDFRAGFAGISEEEIEREAAKALAEVDAERAARRARGEVV